jgi:hypothetical protein
MAGYVGAAADLYSDADHAAGLINATLSWSDERWSEQHRRAVDRAFATHAEVEVAELMVSQWQRELGLRW